MLNFVVSYTTICVSGESETWYTGCYKPDRDSDGYIQMEHVVVGLYTHAQCAQFCNNHRYSFRRYQLQFQFCL